MQPRKPAPKVDRYWDDPNNKPTPSLPSEIYPVKDLRPALHQKRHRNRAGYFNDEHDENPFGIYQSYDIYHDPSIPAGSPSAWASPAAARAMGWSPEVNPWVKPLKL